MEMFIDEYIDPAMMELIKRIGCNECHLFSLKIVKDFSKFIDYVFNKKETIALILSSSHIEKEELADIARHLGRHKQIAVYVFFSDALPADFIIIICYKSK